MGLSCKPWSELRSAFAKIENAERKRHEIDVLRKKNRAKRIKKSNKNGQ